jgi:hypothetical protein
MILVPISVGELVDKLTILKIKRLYITDKQKLENVENEYNELIVLFHNLNLIDTDEDFINLLQVNENIWQNEDKIRNKEREKNFDEDFINYARDIYHYNDERAEIKKRINIKNNSFIIEEKSYQDYK